MHLLFSLGDARDVVIIVWGVLGAIFFAVGLVVLLMVGLTVKSLLNKVHGMLDENVKPTLNSVKDAADTVRGTTEYVGKTAVAPVIKAYGTVAGIKKGLSVFGKGKGK